MYDGDVAETAADTAADNGGLTGATAPADVAEGAEGADGEAVLDEATINEMLRAQGAPPLLPWRPIEEQSERELLANVISLRVARQLLYDNLPANKRRKRKVGVLAKKLFDVVDWLAKTKADELEECMRVIRVWAEGARRDVLIAADTAETAVDGTVKVAVETETETKS